MTCSDERRAVDAGMDPRVAATLCETRHRWRELERDGAPEGWPQGARHYLLVPVAEDDCRVARFAWGEGERAAMHPEAPAFDPLWVASFRRARGLKGTSAPDVISAAYDAADERRAVRARQRLSAT